MSGIQIDLCLFDNPILPKDISERLEIKADTALARGERNPGLSLPRQHLWSVRSDPDLEEVGDHWRNLRGKFGDKWDKFVEIAKGGRAKITVIVYVDGRIPSVIIPPAMAGAAFEIGAPIDIELGGEALGRQYRLRQNIKGGFINECCV